MKWIASSLIVLVQLGAQPANADLSLNLYAKGEQVSPDAMDVIIEIKNESEHHPIEVLKSPVHRPADVERGKAAAAQTYILSLTYELLGERKSRVIESSGGTLVPHQQVTLEPVETTFVKVRLNRTLLGDGARIHVEGRLGDEVVRSNTVTVIPQKNEK